MTTLLYNGKKRTPQEELVYWIQTRERIRILKESGEPKPWSEDPIFQRTYFCNVRREDDRVTKWIRKEWAPEYIGWDDYEFHMVVARFLNWPETLSAITGLMSAAMYDGWFNELEEDLGKLAEKGKVWGNAYVITTHGIPMAKATYLCQRVLPAAYKLLGAGRWRGAYGTRPSLAVRYRDLLTIEGVGSFLAAQILADLKNTEGHPLCGAVDWYSWSAPGPGSLRGLAWFHGMKITEGGYDQAIKEVAVYVNNELPNCALQQPHGGMINMQDLQNCLCEYDKYMRVKNGTGRSKRTYPGV